MTDSEFIGNEPILFKDRRNILTLSTKIAEERLAFLDGTPLGDVDIFIESGVTRRKVRRLIEKRVCQDFHVSGINHSTNSVRAKERHRVTNQMKNIFGGVPEGFRYLGMAV